MKNRFPKYAIPLLLCMTALSGCDKLSKILPVDPAAEAQRAQSAYQLGDYREAMYRIKLALGKRDDVSEYWLTAGRIAMAVNDTSFSYLAYQNVLTLDRGNVEALQALCQVGPAVATAAEVDRYADQLLLLQPTSPVGLTAKGNSALRRGDVAAAEQFADRILAGDPQSARGLVLKAQVMVRQRKANEAGPLLENALKTAPRDQGTLLALLVKLYRAQSDRPRYESAVARYADAMPDEVEAQLRYADTLYEKGQGDAARHRLIDLMGRKPNDVGTQQAVLELWLTQGRTALPLEQIVAEGQNVSLLMRAGYAAYANAMGRPDLARKLLVLDVAKNGTTLADLDAKAVYAEALAMSRDVAQASQLIAQVLAADPHQPKALLARARLELAAGQTEAALSDARQLTTSDPDYVSAQLLLADVLERRGEPQLAEGALRSALGAAPSDPRLTQRLATTLLARNRKNEAADVLKDAAQGAPASLRVAALRNSLCPQTGVADCNAQLKPGEITTLR